MLKLQNSVFKCSLNVLTFNATVQFLCVVCQLFFLGGGEIDGCEPRPRVEVRASCPPTNSRLDSSKRIGGIFERSPKILF